MMAASSQHCCVFVGNIPYDATQEQLIQICEEVGPVVSFRLVVDRETGKPKGYGFCEYKDEETALSARRNLQGYEINGRQLRVDFAENDKGSDRNREQGRGGPGLSSSSDALKPLGGATNIGDPTLHQPIGLTFAAAAASSMAAALGGPQSNNTSSNPIVFQSQPGPGSDSLTHYLSKMTKSQLYEVMSEMKVMATKNKVLARQLLLVSPQLPKALFQAQLMLGLVRPQMLQMPNIRQSSSSIPSQLLQDGPQDQQVLLTLPHGQTPSLQNKMNLGLLPRVPGPVSTVPQNALISQLSSALPPSISIQPHFQQPQQVQPQVRLQAALPGPSGVSLVRPQQLAGLPVQPQVASFMTSTTMKQEVQPPLLQHPRPAGAAHTGNTQIPLPLHPSLPPRPLLSQATFQPNSSNPPPLVGGVEMFSRDSNQSNTLLNLPLGPVEKARTVNDMLEPINHPSKLPRLEDGGGAQRMTVSGNDPSTSGSMPIRLSGAGSISANQTTMLDGTQQSEEKVLQLPPEVESALLQQVMSLTSEQLSSLSPEQRQQVIQLQQMLR